MWALTVVAVGLALGLARWRRSGLSGTDALFLLVCRLYTGLWHRRRSRHADRLPRCGPALVIANHTCSADPTFLMSASPRPVSFLVAREHYFLHPFTHWVLERLQCIPVTRNGQDPGAVRKALRRLADGRIVCLFPEGNLSGIGLRRLRKAKQGAAYLALKSSAPIYPAYIAGGPRTERLLASWLFPSKRGVLVIWGEPVDLSAYRGRPMTRRLLAEVTERIMQAVQDLDPRKRRSTAVCPAAAA